MAAAPVSAVRRRSMSLAGRLTLLSLMTLLISSFIGGYASWTLYRLHSAQTADLRIDELSEATLRMDELHETLQAQVYARLAGLPVDSAEANGAAHDLQRLAFDFADGDDGEDLRHLGTDEYAFAAQGLSLLSGGRPTATQISAFRTRSADLAARVDTIHDQLVARRNAAAEDRRQLVRRSVVEFVVVALGAGAALFATGWAIRRWLLTSLRRLAGVARAVAAGDLTARAAFGGGDEVAELARVLDETSASLQKAFAELDAEALRQDFSARLDRALALSETEGDVVDNVRRALSLVDTTLPVELLVADSSEAHLRTLATTPGVPAPGCRTPTPWSCPAVRSGRPLRYARGEALDACPHLRNRPEGERAAACIPVSFMGRVTGVLHAATAPERLPGEEELARLELIAERVGARMGALQALEQVQRQAGLDSLTGLPNRRSFEDAVRRLRASDRRYGLMLADLDRFKVINDTFGHAAGDQALRRFSDVLRGCLRDEDLPCRFGGEEFAIVIPGADAAEAAAVAERLRAALAASALEATGPAFTVSVGVSDSSMAGSMPDQLALADAALLAAKRSGRDRVLVARAGGDGPAGETTTGDAQVSGTPAEASS